MKASMREAIAMHAIHGVARVALRLQSPYAARRTLDSLASWLRPFENVDEARAAGRTLARRGTCLSRSVAIAARLPGSKVVIGIDVRRSSQMLAHAWVQLGNDVVFPVKPTMLDDAIASF
jgi:hypothetical protein